jgi:hypothetical protein
LFTGGFAGIGKLPALVYSVWYLVLKGGVTTLQMLQIVYEAPILGVYSHLFYINIIFDHTEIVTDFSSNIG